MTEEKKYVKDPIPAKAILLGDAFDWACEEIYANPEILTTLGEFQEILKLNREREERWSRLSEQIFRVDKWGVCRVYAAMRRGSGVK